MSKSIKDSIRRHYDLITPFYLKIWGEHIHHGLWLKGNETKEDAQENLVRELIKIGQIPKRAKILDVGCGLGGSSMYLANHLGALLRPVRQHDGTHPDHDGHEEYQFKWLAHGCFL